MLLLRVLDQLRSRFGRLKVIFADSAYARKGLPAQVKALFGWILQTVLRPVGLKGFTLLPKRWIVERTFGWLGRYRRHSQDYEPNTVSSEAIIYIAVIHLMVRRIESAKS
jgi:putative transposase